MKPEPGPPRIQSGGQTGADLAALDWALASGVPHVGWCPAGRRNEDGCIPDRYQLTETPSADHTVRTQWNVRDSDATAILALKLLLGGTMHLIGGGGADRTAGAAPQLAALLSAFVAQVSNYWVGTQSDASATLDPPSLGTSPTFTRRAARITSAACASSTSPGRARRGRRPSALS